MTVLRGVREAKPRQTVFEVVGAGRKGLAIDGDLHGGGRDLQAYDPMTGSVSAGRSSSPPAIRDGGVAVASSKGPLHTRCRYDGGFSTLFASSAVSVERSFSWNYCDFSRIKFSQGQTYDGSLQMWLTAGKP